MDDVEVTLLLHVAGDYDRVLGQLCSRCGMVLDEGEGGAVRMAESAVHRDHGARKSPRTRRPPRRVECTSILDEDDHLCSCGHGVEVHKFPEEPGGAACWSCSCVEYSEGED